MIFGFVSRTKYVVTQDNEDEFFYNVKTFDDFFDENKITDVLKMNEKDLKNALSKIVNYPKKNMATINRLKKSIENSKILIFLYISWIKEFMMKY